MQTAELRAILAAIILPQVSRERSMSTNIAAAVKAADELMKVAMEGK